MNYAAPQTIEEATSLLASSTGRVHMLAGGTDLLVQLHGQPDSAELLIDVKHMPQTRSIEEEQRRFVIGAAVSGAEAGEHPALRQHWPGLVEALELIGSTQIQSRATLGGNLCNASPAADTVPAMIAAGAACRIAGADGMRELPVEDIITAPGRTCLGRDEFMVALVLPKRAPRSADAYLRLIPRTEMDIAVAGAGVNLSLDEQGRCTAARVALGAVAPVPLRADQAGEVLIGRRPPEVLEELAAAVRAACHPISDKRGTTEYRTDVAAVLACRAARIACQRAEESAL